MDYLALFNINQTPPATPENPQTTNTQTQVVDLTATSQLPVEPSSENTTTTEPTDLTERSSEEIEKAVDITDQLSDEEKATLSMKIINALRNTVGANENDSAGTVLAKAGSTALGLNYNTATPGDYIKSISIHGGVAIVVYGCGLIAAYPFYAIGLAQLIGAGGMVTAAARSLIVNSPMLATALRIGYYNAGIATIVLKVAINGSIKLISLPYEYGVYRYNKNNQGDGTENAIDTPDKNTPFKHTELEGEDGFIMFEATTTDTE